MNTQDIFSKKLFELREQRGLSRQTVADSIGISRASLEYYEKGARVPDILVLVKFADYFQVTCDYLLRGISSENVSIHKELQLSERAIQNIKHLSTNNKYPYSTREVFDAMCSTDSLYKICGYISGLLDNSYFRLSNVVELEKELDSINTVLQAAYSDDDIADGYYPENANDEQRELEHKISETQMKGEFFKWKILKEIEVSIEKMMADVESYI